MKKILLGFFCLVLVFSMISCDTDSGDDFEPNEFELRVFELTNAERTNQGILPLEWDNRLGMAARAHTEDMAQNNFLSHTGSDNSNPSERITRAGFSLITSAENVARGQVTPAAVISSWMNSPRHRDNILNPDLTHLGVGFVNNFWTQKFGTPR